jgi:hypothetical protein
MEEEKRRNLMQRLRREEEARRRAVALEEERRLGTLEKLKVADDKRCRPGSAVKRVGGGLCCRFMATEVGARRLDARRHGSSCAPQMQCETGHRDRWGLACLANERLDRDRGGPAWLVNERALGEYSAASQPVIGYLD